MNELTSEKKASHIQPAIVTEGRQQPWERLERSGGEKRLKQYIRPLMRPETRERNAALTLGRIRGELTVGDADRIKPIEHELQGREVLPPFTDEQRRKFYKDIAEQWSNRLPDWIIKTGADGKRIYTGTPEEIAGLRQIETMPFEELVAMYPDLWRALSGLPTPQEETDKMLKEKFENEWKEWREKMEKMRESEEFPIK